MHTSVQLDKSMFNVRINGAPSSREALFPDWGSGDRLGVVVTSPLGAVGASYLIQLAITAFYDNRPDRRTTEAQYPDIYLFHVGRRFGPHISYDFWPPRKEVLTGARPEDVLDAINDRAITHLAVSDGSRKPVEYPLKEPAVARDRIASCLMYSPTGQMVTPDITIAAYDPKTEENPLRTLEPMSLVELIDSYEEMAPGPSSEAEYTMSSRERDLNVAVRMIALDRMGEVDEADYARAREMRDALAREGIITESYKRITIEEAPERLGLG